MSKTKYRIRESNLRYKQSLGQNFIYDDDLLSSLTEAAGVAADEDVLEIGPGCGSLTKHLCRAARKVLSVELDERLIPLIQAFLAGESNWSLVQGDIMTLNLAEITRDLQKPFAVVANIPYYITSPIIEKVLAAENLPERMVLLMQKEVAERIVSEKETVLSLKCKNRARVRLGAIVPKDEFTPPPKVDSQVIIFEPHAPEVDEKVFEIIQRGFTAPRKKLIHNLAGLKSKEELVKIFAELGFSRDARPADLHLKDYERLYKSML